MFIDIIVRDGKAREAAPLRRFRDDETGSLVIFSLMLLVAMLFTAGLAIDFMRYEYTRTRMQNTADRAVLAATSLGQTQDPEAVVRDYFEKAGLGKHVGNISVEEETSSDTVAYRKVRVIAGATMDPIFLPIMERVAQNRRWFVREGQMQDAANLTGNPTDFTKLPVLSTSSAEEGISDLEISLVLDVSGSMGSSSSTGKSKIYELRKAAKDFVHHMQCNPNTNRGSGEPCEVQHGKVSISIVPYSEQVSAGPQLLSQYNVTTEHNASFCVDFDASDYESVSLSPLDQLQRTGHFDPWRESYQSPSDWTCRTESWRAIKPLLDDPSEVYTAIDALSAGGNTSIDIGMKWGAALLDPDTQSVVTNLANTPVSAGSTEMVIDPLFDGRPYEYGQSYNIKAIILMTDGVNTNQHYLKAAYRFGPSVVWHYTKPDGSPGNDVYSVYNEDKNQYRWVDEDGDDVKSSWQNAVYVGGTSNPGTPYQMSYPEVWAKFTTDWFNDFWWLPDAELAHGNSTKNSRLANMCRAAKDKDILVYTIGFEVGKGSAAETVMRNCASTINHFFLADGMNLSDVFGAIASSINQLKLTE
ncbi:TadE/TadG family type IV pilus assembly protein [Rhodovulum euryhalinum]|uniref:Putative Flp pilus-assembly TadE/G-like protein n=1 Tax=Rhodovulum euryhalinum TaxID=35805 RepID=A0A4R2KRW3_9RHOB|nr:Tad domain-containing protein [Rhodovulum euryhalinum]TCO72868.1 putative Flp pilus-assembly TadE/G-like protein [Rhodovulum euryhalinum]